jgi:Tol biopolymer transport system component
LTDSIGETAVWNAPDAVGTYPITASIVSNDGAGTTYFKTTTFQIYVDNEYKRWTNSPEVQFDPDPTFSGGVVFAQFRNNVTGEADAYNLSTPGLSPVQMTTGFRTLTSPSLRSDGVQLAFAGKRTTADSTSIWVLPGTGGDPSMAIPAALGSSAQFILANSRFARTDRWLLYNGDSTSVFNPKPWFRDGNLSAQPSRVIQQGAEGLSSYWTPAWGPDANGNGLPDSIVCVGYFLFKTLNQEAMGLFKFPTSPEQSFAVQWLPDSSAAEVDWSPDGEHIIFTKRNSPSGDRDIWIINAGSSDPGTAQRVTSGPADDSHPRFSYDGASILFVSNRVDHYGLNGIYNTERRGTNIWSVSRFDLP